MKKTKTKSDSIDALAKAMRDVFVEAKESVSDDIRSDMSGVENRLRKNMKGMEGRFNKNMKGMEGRLSKKLDTFDKNMGAQFVAQRKKIAKLLNP